MFTSQSIQKCTHSVCVCVCSEFVLMHTQTHIHLPQNTVWLTELRDNYHIVMVLMIAYTARSHGGKEAAGETGEFFKP